MAVCETLKQAILREFGYYGPALVQTCRIEKDRCLNRCTSGVYCALFWIIVIYIIFAVEFTQVHPASMWVAPRRPPYLDGLNKNQNLTIGDYCENFRDYWCDAGGWEIQPEGCAMFSEDSIPVERTSQAAGDGVRIPLTWHYEELTFTPKISSCEDQGCNETKGRGPNGQAFCKCPKTKQTLFVPWVVESPLQFVYQMHMQVPQLDVMAANGVNTPYCEGFLTDKFLDHPPEYTKCQKGDEKCLRQFFGLSSMKCHVRLRKGERFQGENYLHHQYDGPHWKDLSSSHFWTDLWGNWHLDVNHILREETEVSRTSSQDSGDPFKCSSLSTGGSIVVQHFVEPLTPDLWLNNIVCRVGHPDVIAWLHLYEGRTWPCFKVRIDIMYLPFATWSHTETQIHEFVNGHYTTKYHGHRGIVILAEGGSGSVRRFSWTQLIVGVNSIVNLWTLRLVIMGLLISVGCRGPGSELYRRAIIKRVSTESMLSAWVCRSLSSLWTWDAAQKLSDKSANNEDVTAKITALLKNVKTFKKPLCSDEEEEERNLSKFVRSIIRTGTNTAIEVDSPQSIYSFPGLGVEEEQWLRANETQGNVTSEDVRGMFEHGAKAWEDITAPAILHGISNRSLDPVEASEAVTPQSYVPLVSIDTCASRDRRDSDSERSFNQR